MLSPFIVMSTLIMFISTMMVLSSTNWIFMWIGFELNLLSFIPIIMISKSSQETEAAVKYFLVQAVSSSIMLMTSISYWFYPHIQYDQVTLLTFMALMLKLGSAPAHNWYTSVMTSTSWMAALILSTWQKLAPLMIITYLFANSMSYLMFSMAAFNAFTGGMLGMNQSHLRTIMAYSSITHMGWMLSLIAMSKPMATIIYFALYSIIISPMFILMHLKTMSSTNSANKLINSSPTYQLSIPILLMSLSGLPPLTGFIPKWLTISILAMDHMAVCIILIIGAMMNTYFYLNIVFNFMLSSKNMPFMMLSPNQLHLPTIVTVVVMCLALMPLSMIIFY